MSIFWPYWLAEREVNGYDFGVIATPQGLVTARSDEHDATLTMITQGCLHRRFFEKGYSRRYFVTLAKRFAAEIEAANPQPEDTA